MLIVSILMGAIAMSYRSAQRAARQKGVAAAATSYDGAVAQFAQDHSGRAPVPGNSQTPNPGQPDIRDWPLLGGGGGPDPAGPRQPALTIPAPQYGPAYMKEGAPEPVTGISADLIYSAAAAGGTSPGATMPATGKDGLIVYRIDTSMNPPVRYRVEVWMATASKTVPASATCWYGNWAIGSETRHEC